MYARESKETMGEIRVTKGGSILVFFYGRDLSERQYKHWYCCGGRQKPTGVPQRLVKI